MSSTIAALVVRASKTSVPDVVVGQPDDPIVIASAITGWISVVCAGLLFLPAICRFIAFHGQDNVNIFFTWLFAIGTTCMFVSALVQQMAPTQIVYSAVYSLECLISLVLVYIYGTNKTERISFFWKITFSERGCCAFLRRKKKKSENGDHDLSEKRHSRSAGRPEREKRSCCMPRHRIRSLTDVEYEEKMLKQHDKKARDRWIRITEWSRWRVGFILFALIGWMLFVYQLYLKEIPVHITQKFKVVEALPGIFAALLFLWARFERAYAEWETYNRPFPLNKPEIDKFDHVTAFLIAENSLQLISTLLLSGAKGVTWNAYLPTQIAFIALTFIPIVLDCVFAIAGHHVHNRYDIQTEEADRAAEEAEKAAEDKRYRKALEKWAPHEATHGHDRKLDRHLSKRLDASPSGHHASSGVHRAHSHTGMGRERDSVTQMLARKAGRAPAPELPIPIAHWRDQSSELPPSGSTTRVNTPRSQPDPGHQHETRHYNAIGK